MKIIENMLPIIVAVLLWFAIQIGIMKTNPCTVFSSHQEECNSNSQGE